MAENENEWKTVNLGQNKTIQEIAAAAATASELLEVNTKLASTTLKAAGVFLLALLNPYVALLNAVADLIDDYVKDFKNIGFYVLEVSDGAKVNLDTLKDEQNKNILLPLSSAAVVAHSAVAMSLNMGEEFSRWALDTLSEPNIYLTGPRKGEYKVQTGPAKPEGRRDDKVSEYSSELDLHTMTPSIVIAAMIAAMDDKADLRRPQFSKNAEAGAIVIIMGIPDMTKGLATIKDTIDAFKFFFGGEEEFEKDKTTDEIVLDECGNPKKIPSTGVIAGIGKLDKLITASLAGIQCPALNNVTVKVNNVCGVRGTEDNVKSLHSIGKSANFKKQFEVGDYVVGPRVKLGARCMGYVSSITEDTTIATDAIDKYTKKEIFYEQELGITGLTNFDRIGWESLSSGAKISTVAFKEKYDSYIDQNSGVLVSRGPFNDFEYISEIQTRTERERFPGLTVTVPKFEFREVTDIYDMTQILQYKYAKTKEATVPYLNIFDNDGSLRTEWEGVDTSILTINRQDSDGNKVKASPSGKEAWTQVVRKPGDTLLTPLDPVNVTEDHKGPPMYGGPAGRREITTMFTTFNTVQGDILESVVSVGTAFNFKSVKLEDFIAEWATFFSAIDALTDSLREMAADAGKALRELIKWLDDKIKEIEDINKALQKVLKLFTDGLGDAGVYVLEIPMATGGNDYIKTQLQSAANKPPDTLDLSIGFLMVGGGIGSASTGFKVLQKLLVP